MNMKVGVLHTNTRRSRERGFTLIELMVALTVGLLLLLMAVQIFSAIRSGQLLQSGLASVQEDGRIALHLVAEEVRKAGFRPAVWNDPLAGYHPVTANSVNGASNGNDTLQFMYMDPRDCNGTLNAVIDPETLEARALYKRLTFTVDGTANLNWTCEYGQTPTALATQISNQTIIDGVDSFQILYGVDTDLPPDMSVNEWTTADAISPETSICLQSQFRCEAEGLLGSITNGIPISIQIGLLVRSPDVVGSAIDTQTFTVLDVAVPAPNFGDNRDFAIRKLYTTTITLRNLTI
jgi:type IV pilus assembly protein PilW